MHPRVLRKFFNNIFKIDLLIFFYSQQKKKFCGDFFEPREDFGVSHKSKQLSIVTRKDWRQIFSRNNQKSWPVDTIFRRNSAWKRFLRAIIRVTHSYRSIKNCGTSSFRVGMRPSGQQQKWPRWRSDSSDLYVVYSGFSTKNDFSQKYSCVSTVAPPNV